jgi:papain like cysteine protease AvrRpt2
VLRKYLISVGLLVLLCSVGQSQGLPPPVDIPIGNIPQQTPVWCWAAVAQQIIAAARGPQATPPQCALVAMANGAPPGVCCSGNPACMVTGSIPQIQMLISQFGGHYSAYAPPTDPMTLYRTLAQRRPVILQIQSSPMSTHVIVVRGMSFVPTRFGIQPMLHVNDPMALYTQPVPFAQIAPIWIDAIVVN